MLFCTQRTALYVSAYVSPVSFVANHCFSTQTSTLKHIWIITHTYTLKYITNCSKEGIPGWRCQNQHTHGPLLSSKILVKWDYENFKESQTQIFISPFVFFFFFLRPCTNNLPSFISYTAAVKQDNHWFLPHRLVAMTKLSTTRDTILQK